MQVRNLHGRRIGHKLSPRQQNLLNTILPPIRISLEEKDRRDPQNWFGSHIKQVWLEIGFGSGEHLVSQAKAHPEIGFIGCEPYINGIVKVLSSIEEGNIGNIRIYDDDAVHVISRLSPKSVDRVFLLFPDPWPKKRHAKRRFVTRENADHLANIMKDGGELRIASDIGAYMRSTLLTFADHKAFAWVDDGPHSWNIRTPDWPPTRYEQKALRADRKPVYLRFLKR